MARLFLITRYSVALLLCALFALPFVGSRVEAAIERYDYDALGRLIRSVDGASQVTEYEYDAVGNILSVTRPGEAQPPEISQISPPSVRRLEQSRVLVTGNNFSGMSVLSPDPTLSITGLQVESSSISFNLLPSAQSPLGPQNFEIQGATGSATFTLRVDPVLPTVSILPGPIAVPPDGSPRNFVVTLSSADAVEHVIALTSSNPAVASITPATVSIAPGQTQATVQISGHQAGLAAIALTSTDLRTINVPVFVTAEFSGLTTSHAPQVGVVIESEDESSIETLNVNSALFGVAFGSYLESITPEAISSGEQAQTLTIRGVGLEGVTGLSVIPSEGLTVGSPVVAPTGDSVAVEVTVSADAPQTLRQVVLSGGDGQYPPIAPGVDRFLISASAPIVESVSPLFATPGTPNVVLTIRGRNLQRASAISLLPGTGLTVGGQPEVNADGSVITVDIAVSPFATAGDHVLVVKTPAGNSSELPTAFNTFRVTEEYEAPTTPVVAPVLGVRLLENEQAQESAYEVRTSALGVSLGPIVSHKSPSVAIVGETVELEIHGESLTDVTSVTFEPDAGLEYGAPVVSADGKMITLPLIVASDAPVVPRKLRVLAEGAQIPFADPNQSVLNVVLPPPELLSVSPMMFEQGTTAAMVTLRGRNLKDAQRVAFDPPNGLVVAPPVISADGTEATLSLSIAADAELGTRTVIITTPAGSSSAESTPSNTIDIVETIASIVSPILSNQVGVVLADLAGEEPVNLVPLVAPLLGVELVGNTEQPEVERSTHSSEVGVTFGPLLTGVEYPPLLPGTTATLTVSGVALQAIDSLQAAPVEGITFSAPMVAADGLSAAVDIVIAPDAAAGPRMLMAYQGQQKIPAQPAISGQIQIAYAEPLIQSMSPILGYQGETLTMVVRGTNLQGASAVLIEPGVGLSIDSHPVVNALGTELTLDVYIEPDAPLGSRVLRVQTPGGITSSDTAPANTFTVYPSE